jgi:two-component system C4-dicarboxylate transport sensor histidine kinase DctB
LQVVLNLVMNAEEALATTEGATLRLVAAADGDRAVLSVQDNGAGITREALEHLYLWPPPSHPDAGALGIGLLVSRALVAGDAGTLSVERGPLGGTVATLSLPRSRG